MSIIKKDEQNEYNNEYYKQINGADPVKEQLEWKDDEHFVWTYKDDINKVNKIIADREAEKILNDRWLKEEILPLKKWLVSKGFIK